MILVDFVGMDGFNDLNLVRRESKLLKYELPGFFIAHLVRTDAAVTESFIFLLAHVRAGAFCRLPAKFFIEPLLKLLQFPCHLRFVCLILLLVFVEQTLQLADTFPTGLIKFPFTTCLDEIAAKFFLVTIKVIIRGFDLFVLLLSRLNARQLSKFLQHQFLFPLSLSIVYTLLGCISIRRLHKIIGKNIGRIYTLSGCIFHSPKQVQIVFVWQRFSSVRLRKADACPLFPSPAFTKECTKSISCYTLE